MVRLERQSKFHIGNDSPPGFEDPGPNLVELLDEYGI